MSFAVQLESETIQVEPGSTAAVTVDVFNEGTEEDRYEISVEGLDAEWTAIPVPTFLVEAGARGKERFFIKPPRDSQSIAGAYPFVARIRSIETGEARTVQGVLEVKTFDHLSIDVQPKKGVVSFISKETDFQVTLMNLGNSEHGVQLFANDPDDQLAFELEHEQLTIGPGHQKTINLSVTSTKSPFLSGARLVPVNVSARSTAHPSVGANAQVNVEQRAMISPGIFALVVGMIALIVGWFLMIPKDPVIDAFAFEPAEVIVGESITVTWQTSHARKVVLLVGSQEFPALEPNGSKIVEITDPGQIMIRLTAINASDKKATLDGSIVARSPEPVPAPEIVEFDINPKRVNLGEVIQVRYRVNEATTKLVLSPVGRQLDTTATGIQIEAAVLGRVEYTLTAENAAGDRVERKVTVEVVDAALVTVVTFTATPQTIDAGGTVQLQWQLNRAVRAELQYDGRVEQVDAESGSLNMQPQGDTEYTLVGYDEQGRTVSRKVAVTVRPPAATDPIPPDDPMAIPPPVAGGR